MNSGFSVKNGRRNYAEIPVRQERENKLYKTGERVRE